MNNEVRPLAPVVRAGMLIRRTPEEVFQAFADPEITTKFWFTKGSGFLVAGSKVQWDWEMYDVSAEIDVIELIPNERIVFEWPGAHGTTQVRWKFIPLDNIGTFVSVENDGFAGTDAEVVEEAMGATQGFTIVLCAAKIYLEQGVEPNFVLDRFPKGITEG